MDNIEFEVDELKHYGVPGMKWGVRKSRPSSGKKRKKSGPIGSFVKKRKAAKKQKAAEAAAKKRKPVSEMTDDELKAAINRLDMEKKYRDLVAASNPRNDRGKKFVSNVLEKSGEKLAVQVVSHYGAKGLNKLIGEDVIYANNKKKD